MFNIGDKLDKHNYTKGAIWCNENNAVINPDTWIIEAIPEPTLKEVKDQKRAEINGDRDNARKTEGAEYDGDIFDIDEVSQSNILAQIKVAEIIGDPNATYNYRSKTNTDHLLTLAQLQELGLAIAVKVNAIYVKSWDLKAQVDKATTAEEVEAIKWTSA